MMMMMMMMTMKTRWMQISIVYGHFDLWPGWEGKWCLLDMITPLSFIQHLFHIVPFLYNFLANEWCI